MVRVRPIFLYIAMALIAISLSGCGALEENPFVIDVTLDRANDSSANVVATGGRAFIDVTDPRGINGLNARLAEGQWPEEITILLRLRGLERLEISYGDYSITTGRSSNDSPDPPLILSVTNENGEVSQASPSADIYYPEILHTEDGFEITLPPHFHRDNYPSFSMKWIDYYR